MNRFFRETLKTISGKAEKPGELIEPSVLELENGIVFEKILKDGTIEVKLSKNGEEVFDFLDFAPPGTTLKIHTKKRWGAEINPYIIYVGKGGAIESILSFLHEAGHLKNSQDVEIASRLKQTVYEEEKKDKNQDLPKSRLRAIAEARKFIIRIEKDAWAVALRKARELEKKFNINIFDRLPETEEEKQSGTTVIYKRVRAFINNHLNDYEDAFLAPLYDVDITKEEMEQLFGQLLSEPAEAQAK